jgi:hypothetical protein
MPPAAQAMSELKTISDGTKLPMVVKASQKHHPWYENWKQ